MTLNYQGANLLPGTGTELLNTEGQIWWGRHEQQVVAGAILDKDTVDAGNTPTTIVRPGLALGYITASKQLTHWAPYATDGSNRLAGFFMGEQTMDFYGTVVERYTGDILAAGNVLASEIIVPGESTKGLAGKSFEFLLREQMDGRFNVDDDLGRITGYKQRELTGAYTAVLGDFGTHFTNTGAGGAVALTLPTPVKPGWRIRVTVSAGQLITLTSGGTNEILVTATASATDVLTAAARETVEIVGIRTATTPTYLWNVRPLPAA